ncbi:MAG: mechanosensitive ion channel domain-containing protein [Candidatus Riflebacteria bacterium]
MEISLLSGNAEIFQRFDEISFLSIFLIVFAALLLNYLVKRTLPELAEKLPPRFRYYLLPMVPLCRLCIMLVTVISIVPLVVRPTLQNLVAIFGAVGLALGFAFKEYASSLIAGIIAIYEQPYRVGDRVTIDGIYGEVQEINLRSVRLLTNEDTVVTIPHSKIWNESIQNANDGSREQLCVADFFIKPGHDAVVVRSILRDVALTSPFTQFRRPVRVSVRERPWGTQYRIKAYPVDGRDEFSYISDLTVKGRVALERLGVGFAVAPAAITE